MSDRSDEKREGWVPVGRRGWKQVGGRGRTEVQPVTAGWARQLREGAERKADKREELNSCDRRRAGSHERTGVPLRIEIKPALPGWWNWKVEVRNVRPSKWNRAPWLPGKSGTALTERGARWAAGRAVRDIRLREKREPIVYYDPPGSGHG